MQRFQVLKKENGGDEFMGELIARHRRDTIF